MSLHTKSEKPNVLLVIVDALRFDVFENAEMASTCWPNLSRLAKSGHLTPLIASAPATQFVCPALFSMQSPLDCGGYNFGIRDRGKSLAEYFKQAGYRTMMHSLCAQLGVSNGYQRGFDAVHGSYDYRLAVMYFGQNILRERLRSQDAGDITEAELTEFVQTEYRAMLDAIVRDYETRKANKFEVRLAISNGFIYRKACKEIKIVDRDPALIIEKYRTIWPFYFARYLGVSTLTKRDRIIGKLTIGLPHRAFDFVNRKLQLGTDLKYGRSSLAVDGFTKMISDLKTAEQPWFCYVHWMDVHDCTYSNRLFHKLARFRFLPKWRRLHRKGLTKRHFKYDAALMALDRYIGRLISHLDQTGNTVVVLTADHAFRKAGGTSRPRKKLGLRLNWEDLEVPLILIDPAGKIPPASGVFDSRTIGASCLASAGIECEPDIAACAVHSGGSPAVVSESAGSGFCDLTNDDLYFAITTLNHRLISVLTDNRLSLRELYDLAVDPREDENLVNDPAMRPVIEGLVSQLADARSEIFLQRGVAPADLVQQIEWAAE
jgi:arylsulfatase A-like enzyme